MEKSKLINVIIRFHNPEKLADLDHALLCLLGQQYRPLEPIVVCQDFSQDEMGHVNNLLRNYIGWDGFYPVAYNVSGVGKGDFRSLLLNEGIKKARGQFLAFFDYDDVLYSNAYSALIDVLEKTDSAIAFANIRASWQQPIKDSFYYVLNKRNIFFGQNKYDLFSENFCPIHSFVINKHKIDTTDLWFDENMSRNEDYHFLLRLVAKYKSDFSLVGLVIGEYCMRMDDSNTIRITGNDAQKDKDWEEAQKWIAKKKEEIRISISLAELISLSGKTPMPKEDNSQSLLNEVLGSRSWRFTAPLRKIGHLVRRFIGNTKKIKAN